MNPRGFSTKVVAPLITLTQKVPTKLKNETASEKGSGDDGTKSFRDWETASKGRKGMEEGGMGNDQEASVFKNLEKTTTEERRVVLE